MRRAGVTCYRVYDADLPDYAVAVDLYERWAHVQEYAAPPEIEPARAAARLAEALRIVPEVLGIAAERRLPQGPQAPARQARSTSGRRRAASSTRCARATASSWSTSPTTSTPGSSCTRARCAACCARRRADARFLNLFGYTGAATVAAAKGGAADTTTVDLSTHYLEWAQRNFALNGSTPKLNATIARRLPRLGAPRRRASTT